MSAPPAPPGSPLLALGATLLVQVVLTLLLASASVLAPAVAPSLGFAPERIGLYAGLAYLVAMLAGLRAGHLVAGRGAIRVSQFALAFGASGALTAAAMPWVGSGWLLLAAAVLIGSGYGLVNPATAAVLAHHIPAGSRGLFFSIKQTGVPIGVALAGLLMPAGLAAIGWRASAVAMAGCAAAVALALLPLARRLEPPRPTAPAPAQVQAAAPGIGAPLRQVWASPVLRRMSLASFAYAATQQVFVTFIVSALNLGLGWSLAASAGLLALSQGGAVAARIAFGALADRTGRPARVLAALGLSMAAACIGLALLVPQTPATVVTAAVLLCAVTAMGWNGVVFAELALHVPPAQMARISGATQFFTFGGGMLGPLVFGESIRAGLGYPLGFAALALAPAAAGLLLLRQPPTRAEGRARHQAGVKIG